MPLPELLTEAEVAQALKLHPRTLRKARQVGGLPHVRIGRCVRYTIEDLTAFLAAATVANDPLDQPARRRTTAIRAAPTVRPFTQRQN